MSTPLRSRWLDWTPEKKASRTAQNRTAKTDKRGARGTFDGFVGAVSGADDHFFPVQDNPTVDGPVERIVAVKITGSLVGDAWVVADTQVLADHPDILRSGLPVFFFDEVEQLRGKSIEELRAIAMVKTEFPTGRVIQ